MKKLFAVLVALAVMVPAAVRAQSEYWTGDGGKGMSLSILVPDGNGLTGDTNYIPDIVQGVLVDDINKYSDITVLDQVALERTLKDIESGVYKDSADFARLGEITGTDYALVGSVTKTTSGYSMSLRVNATKGAGSSRTAYSGTCSTAEFNNHTAIKKASRALLIGMGVKLTAKAEAELAQASGVQYIDGQTALAQGIVAQRSGRNMDALMYFNMANNFDPSLADVSQRVNIAQATITGLGIRGSVQSDIAWRDKWVAALQQADDAIKRQLSSLAMPYSLVYTTRINGDRDDVDYNRRTVTLSIDNIGFFPDRMLSAFCYSIGQSMAPVKQGLAETGRADTWRLRYPNNSSVYRNYGGSRRITVAIVNSRGETIGTNEVNMSYGIHWYGEYFMPIGSTRSNIRFTVSADKLTDDLSIRITAIDGVPVERAGDANRIGIYTEEAYSQTTFPVAINSRFFEEITKSNTPAANAIKQRGYYFQ
jgi:hypothetical protein